MVTNEQHDEQTTDFENAWREGILMLRKPAGGDDPYSGRIVIMEKGKVIADFDMWQGSDGLQTAPLDGYVSLVGERPSIESLRATQGFLPQRYGRFNLLTQEFQRMARTRE